VVLRERFFPEATLLGMETTLEFNQESIRILKFEGIIQGQVLSYQSLSNARSASNTHSKKPMRVIMGDCPWFWVVSPVDAERLITAGYELAV
jgi:hypothetical protein